MSDFNAISKTDAIALLEKEHDIREHLFGELSSMYAEMAQDAKGENLAVYIDYDGRIFHHTYAGEPPWYEDSRLVYTFDESDFVDYYPENDELCAMLRENEEQAFTNEIDLLFKYLRRRERAIS